MDPRLLESYNRELLHLREMTAEFAALYPGVAPRLGLQEDRLDACEDPYVERLLEGFAFLSARVQLEIDKECPSFTRHLLELIYPQFLAPVPSMAVARFQPNLAEATLLEGASIPRGSRLQSPKSRSMPTPCEFRTGHEIRLWPLRIPELRYLPTASLVQEELGRSVRPGVRAGLAITLETLVDVPLGRLPIESLQFFVPGRDDRAPRLLEQLLVDTVELWVHPKGDANGATCVGEAEETMRHVGLREDEALLPPFGFDPAYEGRLRPRRHASFAGYRLLREYFAFAERFRFVELRNLRAALSQAKTRRADLILLLSRADASLSKSLDASALQLNCAPIVNLFPKTADRIALDDRSHEHVIVPHRTKMMDYEVYEVLRVQGHGKEAVDTFDLAPLYGWDQAASLRDRGAYYTLERRPSRASEARRRSGMRLEYLGSDLYLSLVDPERFPYDDGVRQLSIETLCTNRDLPMRLQVEEGLEVTEGEPVARVDLLAGPTRPQGMHGFGDTTWSFLSHLHLNYLSLVEHPGSDKAAPLKALLSCYCRAEDAAAWRQVEDGIQGLESESIVERIPEQSRLTFARGLGVRLRLDETAFEGSGIVVLGAVLDEFFRRYATINSLTRFTLVSAQRGALKSWPVRIGSRNLL